MREYYPSTSSYAKAAAEYNYSPTEKPETQWDNNNPTSPFVYINQKPLGVADKFVPALAHPL